MRNRTFARRASRRLATPRLEAMEARRLMATVAGTLQSPYDEPIAGRAVFVDLTGDGRLDPSDPSAITATDGSFAIADVPAGSYRVVPVIVPGETTAAPTVAVTSDPTATVDPIVVASGSPALPLGFAPDRLGDPSLPTIRREVRAIYRAILSRAPDDTGGPSAAAFLRSGGTPERLAAILLGSPEYRSNFVTYEYTTILGRTPSRPEVDGWAGRMARGLTGESVAAAFFASPEYARLHATDADFAASAYSGILGRSASDAEVTTVVGFLSGGLTRPGLIGALFGSDEATARAVAGVYTAALGRRPDLGGGASAATALKSGLLRLTGLATSLFGSPEFRAEALGRTAAIETLAIPGRLDTAFDAAGILYITDGASIDRYDTRTGEALPSWRLGGLLIGIDLSPDGKTLAVADGYRQGIDLVDIATGVSTRVDYAPAFSEAGAYDVAWGADGTVLITASYNGSGWVPLRSYDPATGVTTVVSPMIRQSSGLSASGDRRTIALVEGNISSGPVHVYDVATKAYVAGRDTSAFTYAVTANADGSQFVVPLYDGARVFDRSGANLVQNTILPHVMYAAYSPTSHYLFTANTGDSAGVNVYDTRDFTLVATLDPVTLPWGGNGAFGTGWLTVSPDGSTLAVSTEGGVTIIDVSAYAGA